MIIGVVVQLAPLVTIQLSIKIEPDKNPYKTQGKILRTCREAKGLTQAELSRRLGVHRSCISRWERLGCRDWLMVCKVSIALGQELEVFRV